MHIKIYLNQKFILFTTLPRTYESLTRDVSAVFETQLPENWGFEYLDDGDKIRLGYDEDYEEFKKFVSQQSGAEIKVDIIPIKTKNKMIIGSKNESIMLREYLQESGSIYYLQEVQLKVEKLQIIFPKDDVDIIWEFVTEAPKDITFEELTLNYMQRYKH